MPILVWTCKDCNTKVERLVYRKQKKTMTPRCHICGKKMQKVKYPGHSFELKGDGWTK